MCLRRADTRTPCKAADYLLGDWLSISLILPLLAALFFSVALCTPSCSVFLRFLLSACCHFPPCCASYRGLDAERGLG